MKIPSELELAKKIARILTIKELKDQIQRFSLVNAYPDGKLCSLCIRFYEADCKGCPYYSYSIFDSENHVEFGGCAKILKQRIGNFTMKQYVVADGGFVQPYTAAARKLLKVRYEKALKIKKAK